MASERILVVATDPPDSPRLRERLRDEIPAGAEVRVVSPATKVSPLDWLTGDEDAARAEASEAAERTAEALEGKAAVEVDRTSQSTDAAENVRDALRQFQPDEIVVVADGQGTWLDEDAVQEALAAPGVPVRRIEPTSAGSS
jgi:ABC-type sugar transport system substrate-binding protein